MEKMKQVRDIIDFAVNNFPFYAQLYADIDWKGVQTEEDMKKLPMITAEDLINHRMELQNHNQRPYRVTSSSGTLGKPKVIYRSREDTKTSVEVLKELLQMAGVTKKDTVFIGQPFDMAHFGYLVLGGCEKINAISIPVGIAMSNERYMSFILTYQPTVICSSLSRVLAVIRLLEENAVASVPFVKTVILAGEPVNQPGIEKIREYFNTAPFNFYGSEETDGLAGDCCFHQGLHFFEEHFFMELLEVEGQKPRRAGNKIGELVITSLYQKGVPLIRYRLGDVVEVEQKRCTCGCTRPLIHVYGRVKDSFTVFDGVTVMAYQIEDAIKQYAADFIHYQVMISSLVPGFEEILVKIETKSQEQDIDEQALTEALWNCSEDLSPLRETGNLKIRVAVNTGTISVTQRGKTKKIIDLRDK